MSCTRLRFIVQIKCMHGIPRMMFYKTVNGPVCSISLHIRKKHLCCRIYIMQYAGRSAEKTGGYHAGKTE